MIKKVLKTGFTLFLADLIYWILLTSSKLITGIMNMLITLLWIYLNYAVLSSNSRHSLLMKLTQLYAIPFVILIIGIVGKCYNKATLSVIFSIYFMPFISISIMFFKDIIKGGNYLIAPFPIMLIITVLTFFYCKGKN